MPSYCLDYRDVAPKEADDDTVLERHVLDPETSSVPLTLRVLTFAPGRSAERSAGTSDEILFVVSGGGTLVLGGEASEVQPETGVYVAAGGVWQAENPGPEDLVVVSWLVPSPLRPVEARTSSVVPLEAQDSVDATGDRQFRYVVNRAAGCQSATQFVGYVPPGRAPEHYHTYGELAFILEGAGTLHIDGGSYPFSPGSCLAFPAKECHSVENQSDGTVRVLGVFVPAGSPAEAYYPDGTLAFAHDSDY